MLRPPRRGLRPPLRGAWHSVLVDAHAHVHDGLRSNAHFAEGHRGGGPEADQNNRSVERRGRSGRREDEPHVTAGSVSCGSHNPLIGVGRTAYDPSNEWDLANRGDDLVREAREVSQELRALSLQPLDVRVVLVQPAGALVQLPRLQHLVVVDARH
jgi:hypothetical protein